MVTFATGVDGGYHTRKIQSGLAILGMDGEELVSIISINSYISNISIASFVKDCYIAFSK